MSKLDIKIEISDTRYKSGTLYTNSPKFFMKYYLCNEVEECGICLSGEAISMVEGNSQASVQTNEKTDVVEDRFIPFPTAKEAVKNYKTALKVIDVEEINRILNAKEIWKWIKTDIMDIDGSNLAVFGLFWLFSDKSLGYSAWLAALCLLCNMNLDEVVRMVRAIFIKGHNKELLETEVWEIGLSDLIYTPVKREDLKLYMKVKDGNFRFK